MLLESTIERPAPSQRIAAEPISEWQDYLVEKLAAHPLFRRRQIELCGGKGRVVLTGQVASFYEKQMAQEYVRRIEGVESIDNRIEVAYS